MNYESFFQRAVCHAFDPYPYQQALAENPGFPSVLRIPTGAGKTEAVILGWLYKRFFHPDSQVRSATPRRLVYCLPMRTLVEQTVGRVEHWCANLELNDKVEVVTLMGGESRTPWYLYPEKPCILVGTQDMLLSRALNRGYGNSPFMWPVEYGLLNNDCLWILDEVQLMANGLPTTTQLAGLRHKVLTFGPVHSIWMSATVKPDWLATVDHPQPPEESCLALGPADLSDPSLKQRFHARKTASEVGGFAKLSGRRYVRRMAEVIADKHVPGTLTLVIVNRVERAQAIFRALRNSRGVRAKTLLIHSRFRESDRKAKSDELQTAIDASSPGRIVVATQAVEAGVDISARTLITELAPWSSMVQRFGRCNRQGEFDLGRVFWIDPGERNQDTAPYASEEVNIARCHMKSLEGQSAGASDLDGVTLSDVEHHVVIRRRDVIGLFDTTPDLSGSYLDVAQYVRGSDARDVSVFWRELPQQNPGTDAPKPRHSEIVGVPLGGQKSGPKGIRDYLDNDKRKVWHWDVLDGQWRSLQAREIYPGMILMLDARQGGYSSETGWDSGLKEPVQPVPIELAGPDPEDDQSADHSSIFPQRWISLIDHTRHVVAESAAVMDGLSEWLDASRIREAMSLAARYHDVGKAHPVFQAMLTATAGKDKLAQDRVWAKSPGKGKTEYQRPHFRHELGSALAILQHAKGSDVTVRELAAYLAAAHHGKVRLSIRSLPNRRRNRFDSHPDPKFLLGYPVEEPDTLPPVDVGEGEKMGATSLDMSISAIGLAPNGHRSWLDRSLDLLDWLGPFRLAYLEALLRAADMRASMQERAE